MTTKRIKTLLIALLIVLATTCFWDKKPNSISMDFGGTENAIENYKSDVDKYAKKYNLPPSYLMALIMLECSGRKNVKPRFEKHVYIKLQKLRNGEIKKFEDLVQTDVKNLSNSALKELSKSYGPFQIMGYKSIKMGIDVTDLKGRKSVAYGAKWINDEYGNYLRKKRYKDAFHLHNTGQTYPKNGKPRTHDPKYVENGLYYLKYFDDL